MKMDIPTENNPAGPSFTSPNNMEQENECEEEDIGMKMEYSASGFRLVNVFVDEVDTLQTIEQPGMESDLLISHEDPLSSETAVDPENSFVIEKKEKSEQEIAELFKALNIKNTKPTKCLEKLTVCSSSCYTKVPQDEIKRNFDSYWKGATFASRYKFINEMIDVIPTKYRFSKNPKFQRYKSKHYLHVKEDRQTVCRICFRRVICEHDRLIETILEEKFDKLNGNLPLLSWSPLSKCKNNCHLKITTIEQQRNLFSYTKAKTETEKMNFLKKLIVVLKPEIKQDPDVDENQKNIYFVTFSLNSKGGLRTVCQQCFRNVFNESESLIKIVLSSKWREIEEPDSVYMDEEAVDLLPDTNVCSKTTTEQHNPTSAEIEEVVTHLKKFPLCDSHHFPGQSSNQNSEKYLPIGLTLATLYRLYRSSVAIPMSFDRYQFILKQTNFKFQPTLYGKCEICEETMKKLRLPTRKGEKEMQTLLANHLLDVQEAKEAKSRDQKTADESNNTIWVCSFGYLRSLPTPCLNNTDTYYRLPLWTYNFTIQRHNSNSTHVKRPKFYIWNEDEGGKTANEMASCLYSYLVNLNRKIRSVIFYSSSDCPESRSKTVSMMFSYFMVTQKKLITLEHRFLPAGHFPDTVQNVENWTVDLLRKFRGRIQEPKNWCDAFNNPYKSKGMFEVVRTMSTQFYNFERLWTDSASKNQPLLSSDVKRLLYTKKGVVCYTNRWSADAPFEVLTFEGQLQLRDLLNVKLEKLENAPLTEKKLEDLKKYVSLMRSFRAKNFYVGLLRKYTPSSNDVEPETINRDVEMTIIKEEIDLGEETQEIDYEEDWELPKKIQKTTSCESDLDQFEMVVKEEKNE